MPTLYPTDPQDWLRTEAERKDKEQERKEKADKERREKRGLLLQLFFRLLRQSLLLQE